MRTPLPDVFDELQPLSNVKYNGLGWSAANCPVCGYSDLRRGDRLVLNLAGHGGRTHTNAWCRQCKRVVWRPKMRGGVKPLHVNIIHKEPDYTRQLARIAKNQQRYVSNVNSYARAQWLSRFVDEISVKEYRLGYNPTGRWREDDVIVKSPSLTIPFFHQSELRHIQHRIIRIPKDFSRYRWDVGGLPKYLWKSHELFTMEKRKIFLVEGAIKGMVLKQALASKYDLVPVWAHCIAHITDLEASQIEKMEVIYFPDPDVWRPKVVNGKEEENPVLKHNIQQLRLGGNTGRIIAAPDKIDDHIDNYPFNWWKTCPELKSF